MFYADYRLELSGSQNCRLWPSLVKYRKISTIHVVDNETDGEICFASGGVVTWHAALRSRADIGTEICRLAPPHPQKFQNSSLPRKRNQNYFFFFFFRKITVTVVGSREPHSSGKCWAPNLNRSPFTAVRKSVKTIFFFSAPEPTAFRPSGSTRTRCNVRRCARADWPWPAGLVTGWRQCPRRTAGPTTTKTADRPTPR